MGCLVLLYLFLAICVSIISGFLVFIDHCTSGAPGGPSIGSVLLFNFCIWLPAILFVVISQWVKPSPQEAYYQMKMDEKKKQIDEKIQRERQMFVSAGDTLAHLTRLKNMGAISDLQFDSEIGQYSCKVVKTGNKYMITPWDGSMTSSGMSYGILF